MIQRLQDAWRMVRPRTLAKTHKGIDDLRVEVQQLREELREFQRALKGLREQDRGVVAEVRASLDALGATVARLDLGESQLRAIALRDIELAEKEASLASVMREADIRTHVERQCRAATVLSDPCPYVVIDELLPKPLYDALILGLPPVELFADRPDNKRQLAVPFKLAPSYARRIWSYMAWTVASDVLMPVMIEMFRPALDDWMRRSFPALGENPVDRLDMNASEGRIILRTRGYVIPPHRDPKWGFLTCILYLARPGDSERWGTQFYRVDGDEEAVGAPPHWVGSERCHEVADITFVPNRAIIFLNSSGAHGARIPADAPEGLERYIYQFRVGPRTSGIASLMDTLPIDRRALWAGKTADY